jgi:uncharacterized protein (DUF1501 family)
MQRREFLTHLGVTGLALGSGARTLGMPRGARAADTDGYRALVCVFLLGGNDSFNMVVPRSTAEYTQYATSRQNLAVPQGSLLPITPRTSDGALYGVHPAMTGLQGLFAAGRAALVANVGPLIQPTTRAEVLERAVPLPPQLFSHNDQQDQWQSVRGSALFTTGWAGRVADLLETDLATQHLPTNLSIVGNLPWQVGRRSGAYVIGEQGAVSYFALDAGVFNGTVRRRAFEALIGAQSPTPYGRALSLVHQRSLDLEAVTQAALAAAPPINTLFPASPLGAQLAMVARVISARQQLASRRQIFLVAIGGFDTHDAQNTAQPALFAQVSAGVTAFDAAMQELGLGDDVTTFTMSEFGRTLTSNGDGTDHGWGGHQWVVGGAVHGGDIFGRMPRLDIDGPDDVGGGRIVPTHSVQQYGATLLRGFGLSEGDIDTAVTGLSPFVERDLGFLI